jgi:hypothetical protein
MLTKLDVPGLKPLSLDEKDDRDEDLKREPVAPLPPRGGMNNQEFVTKSLYGAQNTQQLAKLRYVERDS